MKGVLVDDGVRAKMKNDGSASADNLGEEVFPLAKGALDLIDNVTGLEVEFHIDTESLKAKIDTPPAVRGCRNKESI